jgi:FAD/FMN-containing dehydrogenase
VDVSTSAQATLGGMAGNNSCGSRSIRYGNMVHNVRAIDAVAGRRRALRFGAVPTRRVRKDPAGYRDRWSRCAESMHRGARAEEIEARFPKVLRRVGGYNLDMLRPRRRFNLAHLLVGSEGTLAWFERLTSSSRRCRGTRCSASCHFPTFYRRWIAQHIVKLKPAAVELVDRTMIELARGNPAFRAGVDAVRPGEPDAILLVEFAGEDATRAGARS